MSQQSTERKTLANPLADPVWAPVVDVIRKCVFRRDREATHITLEDFRESLRYVEIRAEAIKFLSKELGELPQAANEAEIRSLLSIDNSRQQRLRFEDTPGALFKKALQRYEYFLSLAPLSSQGKLQHAYQTLLAAGNTIPGQELAAHDAAQWLAIAITGKSRALPVSLFLHGPHGAGCREMSSAIAQAMVGLGYAPLELDLSQYRNEGEEASIRGSKPYWSGSRAGDATGFIHQHSKAVIVVHNADRSLPRVLEAFMQPLTTGNWVDQFGLEDSEEGPPRGSSKRSPTSVDCRQAIFIFNASEGSQWYQNPDYQKFLESQSGHELLLEAMRDATQEFRGESMPVFHGPLLDVLSKSFVRLTPVSWANLRAAAKDGLQQASRKIGRRFGCQISVKNARAIADLHLLRTAPSQGVSACNAKSFEEGVFADFASWRINNETDASAKLDIAPEAIEQLEKIIAALGGDPVATLKRKTQSVLYTVSIEKDEVNGVRFIVRDLTLQKTPQLKDFTGSEIHLEASVPDVRFSDVAGHTEAKDFFREMIEYLRRPALVSAIGVDLPKGVLLYGEPGTGKTKLAQAFAGEAGLPFIAVTGSDLLYPQRISELYRIARNVAPCVIFIDEVDVIGKRGQNGAAHDAAINTLLTSIQGFAQGQEIFHILATNRPNSLDEALLRPGRIDRKFYCGALDREGRANMLKRLAKVAKLAPKAIDHLLPLTYGMTGAYIEQIVREVGLRRLRQDGQALSVDEVIDEINTQKWGKKRRGLNFDATTRRRIAVHEIGHALLLSIQQPELPIEVVTITPRSNNAAGFVSVNAENFELAEETPSAVRTFLACRLAGRVAEMIAFGQEGRSSGATSDLSIATRAAYRAVAYSGLDEEMPIGSILGFREFGEPPPAPLVHKAWERVQIWLQEAEREALRVLQEHWPLVEHLTDQLLEKEHLSGDEFAELIAGFHAVQTPTTPSGEQS